MSKKEELKEEIWNIWKINLQAKESFSYAYYLNKPSTDLEQNYLNNSRDFHFIRISLWKMSVIELSKLFKKSERYSVFKFIMKLKAGGQFGKMGISTQIISEWESQIEENENLIIEILNLRDKLYSHTDANSEKYKINDITFEKTEKLILFVDSIIQEIYSTVFDTHAVMHTVYFKKENFKIIKILAEEKENRMKELFKDYLKGAN